MKATERQTGRPSVDGDEPADHTLYTEYVRGFDEIPVLDDAVRIPPRRAPSPNFVDGERRSLRKEERCDGYTVREDNLSEIESLYGEYVAPKTAKPKRKQPRAKKKTASGKTRRKSSAAA